MALRRQVKNVVKNFSDIEVKVREATSNDPWGPSSSLTSEIADATYNVQAFTEIMTLLWRRINDHGKNWRHVYKSLVVLEYIVKTGSERVAQQCKENIFAIKTLKDFQFIDKDGKDQGVNVREKSKLLVALLKDEERLKSERQRALKAKERFTQSQGGIGNTSFPKNRKYQGTTKYPESARESQDDLSIPSQTYQEPQRSADSRSTDGRIDSEIEKVRPSNEAEEEMQLQIALAMSREEAEKDQRTSQVDKQLFGNTSDAPPPQTSTLLNLTDPTLSISQGNSDAWMSGPSQMQPVQPTSDPWGSIADPPQQSVTQPGPWGDISSTKPKIVTQPVADPWGISAPAPAPTQVPAPAPVSVGMTSGMQSGMQSTATNDPWGLPSTLSQPATDPFAPQNSMDSMSTPIQPEMSLLNNNHGMFGGQTSSHISSTTSNPSSGSFLANGSHLVDIDNIMAKPGDTSTMANPFMTSANTNPFSQDKPKPKSINELRNDKNNAFVSQQSGSSGVLLPTPMQPSQNNPFL